MMVKITDLYFYIFDASSGGLLPCSVRSDLEQFPCADRFLFAGDSSLAVGCVLWSFPGSYQIYGGLMA